MVPGAIEPECPTSMKRNPRFRGRWGFLRTRLLVASTEVPQASDPCGPSDEQKDHGKSEHVWPTHAAPLPCRKYPQ